MAKKGTLEIKILGDSKGLEKSMDKASGILKGFAGGAVGIFAGLGAAAGAVLVSEFGDAMERERLADRLGAQLGATAEEAERYGKIAGELYEDAFGDSMAQVHDAVDAVVSSLGDLDDTEVRDLTAKALDLAAAFDVDVNESVAAAGVLMRQGLARDADHAFDLIVSGMQNVPAAMRGELIPTLEEYAQDFAALGITGEEAFGLLADASGDGRIELDKTADAIKELTIRSTDLSTASREAYETIGLDAEEMAGKIVQGGETAREGFGQIIDGLLEIEDPAEQANTAIALMGTPLEDLSVTEIPEFLQRLDDMGGSFGDVQGAAQRMGDDLNNNVSTSFTEFKRKAGGAIDAFLAENVLPGTAEIIAAFEEDGVGGALDKAIELWEAAQPRIEEWWDGTFTPFWEDTAVPWMQFVGGEMGVALVNGFVQALVNGLMESLEEGGPIGQWIDTAVGLFNSVWGTDLDISGPTFELPDINVSPFSNPVARPTSGPSGSTSTSSGAGFTARFHDGGLARVGGIAQLADKERVLSPRQTEAFEKLVAQLTSGTGGGDIYLTVHAGMGADGDNIGDQIVRHLIRYQSRNGTIPLKIR